MDSDNLVPADLPDPDGLAVATVGRTTWPSPLLQRGAQFVDDDHGVLCSSDTRNLVPYIEAGRSPPAFEEAGPRRLLAFDPSDVTAAIVVTCGGLAGKTDVVVGYHHRHFTHLPVAVATARRRRLRPDGDLWQSGARSRRASPDPSSGAERGPSALFQVGAETEMPRWGAARIAGRRLEQTRWTA